MESIPDKTSPANPPPIPNITLIINPKMFLGNFKDEDFLQDSFEPFIKSRHSTNVLNFLVPDELSRSTICESFIQSFSGKGRKLVTSSFHLKFALEVLGHSLSLPSKRFFSTIQATLTIYSDWLNFPEYAPVDFKASRSEFVDEIIGHMSLTFYPQKEIVKQVEVCKDVIKIWDKFSQRNDLTEANSVCLLKVMIETCKAVLANQKLSDGLGRTVVLFLFQLFVRTSTRDRRIWDEFMEFVWQSCEFLGVCLAWSACFQGISRTLVKYLLGSSIKPLKIAFINSQNILEQFHVSKDSENIVYLWSRFLSILLKGSRRYPPNRLAFVSGVCSSINSFLLKNEKFQLSTIEIPKNLTYSSNPSLNQLFELSYKSFVRYLNHELKLPVFSIVSIMSIFGDYLFSIINDVKSQNNEKVEVLTCLCRIFQKTSGPYPKIYIEKFLKCVMEAVSTRSPEILAVISEEFTKLLLTHTDFLNFALRTDTIIQVSSYFLLGNQNNSNVKFSCLKLVSSFASLASFLSISGLTQQISDTLLVDLLQENDERSYATLMWTIVGYFNGFKGDSELLDSYIKSFAEELDNIDQNLNNIILMLEVLETFPYLVDLHKARSENLKLLIKKLVNIQVKKGKMSDEILFRAFQCAIGFLSKRPDTMTDHDFRIEVFKALDSKKTESRFKESSIYFFQCIMRITGDINSNKRRVKEEVLNNSAEFFDCFCHYSVIENQRETNIVVNNSLGQRFWKLKEIGYDSLPSRNLPLNLPPVPTAVQYKQLPEDSPAISPSYTSENLQSFNLISQKFSSQKSIQESFKPQSRSLNSSPQGQSSDLSKSYLYNYRRLITMLGSLDLDSTDNLVRSNKSTRSLVKVFKNLPNMSNFNTCLLYLATPECINECMDSVQSYSENFSNFLKSAGEVVEGKDIVHESCRGLVERFGKVLFKDFEIFESVLTCPAFCGNGGDFRDFVREANCVVLWNQRLNDPDSKKVPSLVGELREMDKMVVVVTPIGKSIVRVNLEYSKKRIGPIVSDMVVSIDQLFKFIQFSVYVAFEEFNQRFELWKAKTKALNDCVLSSSEQRININDMVCLFEH